MYRIDRAAGFAKTIYQIWIRAPNVARRSRAGQFVIIRIGDPLEHSLLTITAVKGDFVRFIFMVIGKTIEQLGTFMQGISIGHELGLLEKYREMMKYGTSAVEEGGSGLARTSLIAREARA